MAAGPHTFLVCDVFTAEKYQGNRLAIVAVRSNALSQERKAAIAREFGFSETVFLHDAPAPGQPRKLDIFVENGDEIPFAGHPVIGTAHYIFMTLDRQPYTGPGDRAERQTAVVQTKAGPIPIFFNPYRQVAACSVPHDVHVHKASVSFDDILSVQPQLQMVPTINKLQSKTFPIVSIVKGLTFALVDLTQAPDVLLSLKASQAPEMELDADWKPSLCAALYFVRRGTEEKAGEPTIHNIHARMITAGQEDPGTGSANCALACYMALNRDSWTARPHPRKEAASETAEKDLAAKVAGVSLGDKMEHTVLAVEQGIEMGRKCTIAVEVDVNTNEQGEREVSSMLLSGRATFVMKGEFMGIY